MFRQALIEQYWNFIIRGILKTEFEDNIVPSQ